MTGDFDLLGAPIPETWGKCGRPAYALTHENSNKISPLLPFGRTNRRIARALKITGATRKKYYFANSIRSVGSAGIGVFRYQCNSQRFGYYGSLGDSLMLYAEFRFSCRSGRLRRHHRMSADDRYR